MIEQEARALKPYIKPRLGTSKPSPIVEAWGNAVCHLKIFIGESPLIHVTDVLITHRHPVAVSGQSIDMESRGEDGGGFFWTDQGDEVFVQSRSWESRQFGTVRVSVYGY